jgi:hypothetical protein
MILAIGLRVGLKNHGSSAQQSDGCFNSALKYIDSVLSHRKSDIETLSSVLLLTQYVSLCPSRGSLWQIVGIALRRCIDLGLHWGSSSIDREDPSVTDTRRRLFWTIYKLDRLLCITLGRPFGIVDQSISARFPELKPDVGSHSPGSTQS